LRGKKKNTGLQVFFFSFLEFFYLWLHKKCNYKFGPQGEKKNSSSHGRAGFRTGKKESPVGSQGGSLTS
jgi:hypothetical protein